MAKGSNKPDSTPVRLSTLKKQNSSIASNKSQASILGFFSKTPSNASPKTVDGILKDNTAVNNVQEPAKSAGSESIKKPSFKKPSTSIVTPVASSDPLGPPSSQENENGGIPREVDDATLPSPVMPAKMHGQEQANDGALALASSPSRKVITASEIPKYITNWPTQYA